MRESKVWLVLCGDTIPGKSFRPQETRLVDDLKPKQHSQLPSGNLPSPEIYSGSKEIFRR